MNSWCFCLRDAFVFLGSLIFEEINIEEVQDGHPMIIRYSSVALATPKALLLRCQSTLLHLEGSTAFPCFFSGFVCSVGKCPFKAKDGFTRGIVENSTLLQR